MLIILIVQKPGFELGKIDFMDRTSISSIYLQFDPLLLG
jgi:hypothetical protein